MNIIYGLILFAALVIAGMIKKNIHIWLCSYLTQGLRERERAVPGEPKHLIFCFVDHYEPKWNNASDSEAAIRVDKWVSEYPVIAGRHCDSDGKKPQHTFFFPQEQYSKEQLDKLAGLCKTGMGEVEIHLHHDNDTSEGLRQKLEVFRAQLDSHGLLPKGPDGKLAYGFIHGDWALDNSLRGGRNCGVNDELTILKETGCYADFTLPSAPSEAQTSKINSIYYALDNPVKAKSHDHGVDVAVGRKVSGHLMIIQGPLSLNWRRRKWNLFPRIENGDVSADNQPTKDRVDLWVNQNIRVKGKPNWIFVKVYTHGCQEIHFNTLLGQPIDDMHTYLETRYNDKSNYFLHYATAREMYNIIKAAEAGKEGNPNQYRDFVLKKSI